MRFPQSKQALPFFFPSSKLPTLGLGSTWVRLEPSPCCPGTLGALPRTQEKLKQPALPRRSQRGQRGSASAVKNRQPARRGTPGPAESAPGKRPRDSERPPSPGMRSPFVASAALEFEGQRRFQKEQEIKQRQQPVPRLLLHHGHSPDSNQRVQHEE